MPAHGRSAHILRRLMDERTAMALRPKRRMHLELHVSDPQAPPGSAEGCDGYCERILESADPSGSSIRQSYPKSCSMSTTAAVLMQVSVRQTLLLPQVQVPLPSPLHPPPSPPPHFRLSVPPPLPGDPHHPLLRGAAIRLRVLQGQLLSSTNVWLDV